MSLTNQRAQVPGYCGYIPGKNSENKFGGTFAQVSKNAYPTQQQSFLTTNFANNQFIQKQHQKTEETNQFWNNSGKISAFSQPNKQPKKNNIRMPAQKYIPEKLTDLTYEEAINRRI